MTTKVRYAQPLLGVVQGSPTRYLVSVPGASVLIRQDGVACDVFADNAGTALANPVPIGVAIGSAGVDTLGTLVVYLEAGNGYDAVATVGDASSTFAIPDISPDVADVLGPIPPGTYVPATGGTMTGALVLAADPTANLQAATKQYVDAGVGSASGVTAHLTDAVDAHDASAVSFAPAGGVVATDVQAAIIEVAGDAVAAVQRANHTGTQFATTISDLTEATQDAVGGALTDTATLDLTYNDAAGTISGAVLDSPTVAGATPAQLRDRSTHTGAQAESTVTGLVSDLAAKLPLAGGTLTGALVLAANAAAALQAVPKQQLDSGLALKADDTAVVKLTGDQTKTARLTMRSVGVEPVAADNGAFALKGRHWTGIVGAVPYVVPTGPGADQLVALDLVVKGTPVNTPDLGVAWIDICDSNEAEVDADNYQATRIGKTRDGYGYVTVAEGDGANGSNPNAVPLVLQHMGGGVGIGAGAKAPAARLHVSGDTLLAAAAAGNVPLTLKGAASQTADLLKIQDSAATDLLRVTAAGRQLIGSSTMLGVTSGVVDAMLVVNQPSSAIQTQIWRGSPRGDGFAYTARISDGAHFTTNGAITSNGQSALLPQPVREAQTPPSQYMFAAHVDLSPAINNAAYVSDTVNGIAHFNGFVQGGGLYPYFRIAYDGELQWSDGATSAAASFTALRREADGSFAFRPNGSEKVRFKATGEVGINNASPTNMLTIDAASAQLRLRSSPARYRGDFDVSASGLTFTSYDDTGAVFQPYITQSSQVQWRVGFTEKMRLDGNGDVGMGTNSPQSGLHVVTRSQFWPAIRAQGAASQSDPIQVWQNSSATALFSITAAGLPRWNAAANQHTTVGAAGGASALPATPTTYVDIVTSAGTLLCVAAYVPA